MEAPLWISLWAALFMLTHTIPASAAIRPRLIAKLGEGGYRAVHSLLALATLSALAIEFSRHKHAGPLLWHLGTVAPLRWLVWLTMAGALALLVAGLLTPNPGAIIGVGELDTPRGILKLTRHPVFAGFALFGLGHMVVNGWLGDVIFFGTFVVLAVLGGWHQDRRKVAELGASYKRFMERTSFFPGTAGFGGQPEQGAGGLPWAAIGIGLALTALVAGVHPWLFGGHPLG